MQQMNFRNTVAFNIPDDWVEDVDLDDEAGLYYEDMADAGILRLSFSTAQNPNPVTSELLAQVLDAMSNSKTKKLEVLKNGNTLLSYTTKERQEDGSLDILYVWIVGNPLPPHHARIANFSYTVEAVNVLSAKTQNAVTMLEHSIRNAEFASDQGRGNE